MFTTPYLSACRNAWDFLEHTPLYRPSSFTCCENEILDPPSLLLGGGQWGSRSPHKVAPTMSRPRRACRGRGHGRAACQCKAERRCGCGGRSPSPSLFRRQVENMAYHYEKLLYRLMAFVDDFVTLGTRIPCPAKLCLIFRLSSTTYNYKIASLRGSKAKRERGRGRGTNACCLATASDWSKDFGQFCSS